MLTQKKPEAFNEKSKPAEREMMSGILKSFERASQQASKDGNISKKGENNS